MNQPAPPAPSGLDFLYTDIGRGHPFYLDGIIESLVRSGHTGALHNVETVFDISTGPSLRAWRLARWFYKRGSSGGQVGKLYRRLRRNSNYNEPSKGIEILGRSLREKYKSKTNPLIVAHPLLVATLKERVNLIYQHGELVVPGEALVRGASKILVPTEDAAKAFIDFGYDKNDVVVTGLCIEPDLFRQAESAYSTRLARINGQEHLTGLFVSSGAEPKPHLRKLIKAAISTINAGHRAVILAHEGGHLSYRFRAAAGDEGIVATAIDSTTPIPAEFEGCLLIEYSTRREVNSLTAAIFSWIDFFVSPAHERVNWALGLGLPLFTLSPFVGPFAPLNQELVVHAGVAESIIEDSTADRFAAMLTDLRQTGRLTEMAANGRGGYNIDGFARCADFLLNNPGRK